jgi:hypothetical protein
LRSLTRAALLYQSTYPAERPITRSSLSVGCYHFSVAINGGVCTVACLGGFYYDWLMTVVVVVSVFFASGVHTLVGFSRYHFTVEIGGVSAVTDA